VYNTINTWGLSRGINLGFSIYVARRQRKKNILWNVFNELVVGGVERESNMFFARITLTTGPGLDVNRTETMDFALSVPTQTTEYPSPPTRALTNFSQFGTTRVCIEARSGDTRRLCLGSSKPITWAGPTPADAGTTTEASRRHVMVSLRLALRMSRWQKMSQGLVRDRSPHWYFPITDVSGNSGCYKIRMVSLFVRPLITGHPWFARRPYDGTVSRDHDGTS